MFATGLHTGARFLNLFRRFLFRLSVTRHLAVFIPFHQRFVMVIDTYWLSNFRINFHEHATGRGHSVMQQTNYDARNARFLSRRIFRFTKDRRNFNFLMRVHFINETTTFHGTGRFMLVTVCHMRISLHERIDTNISLFMRIRHHVL